MSRYDTFNRILTSLHEATFDDTQWLYASTLISEACGAVGNALVVADTSEELPRILFAGFYGSTERRDDLERLYFVGSKAGAVSTGTGSCCLPEAFTIFPVPQSVPWPRFQLPPHRTQHADFPHYALLFASYQGLWDLSSRERFQP